LPKKFQILLVEDGDSDALLIERALRTAGIANPIYRARNGAEAIAFLNLAARRVDAPDAPDSLPLGIVFLDLKLPDKSGFDLLQLMQNRPAFEDVTRIVISQIDDMHNIRKAYTLGADTFIAKPVHQSDVAELIRSFPENWFLVDAPRVDAVAPDPKPADPYDQAMQVWSKNRELIQSLRQNLANLRAQVDDNEETFAIIETLTQELRHGLDPGRTAPGKKRRPTSFLL
jgi:CheY-like chemotaxis protein